MHHKSAPAFLTCNDCDDCCKSDGNNDRRPRQRPGHASQQHENAQAKRSIERVADQVDQVQLPQSDHLQLVRDGRPGAKHFLALAHVAKVLAALNNPAANSVCHFAQVADTALRFCVRPFQIH